MQWLRFTNGNHQQASLARQKLKTKVKTMQRLFGSFGSAGFLGSFTINLKIRWLDLFVKSGAYTFKVVYLGGLLH